MSSGFKGPSPRTWRPKEEEELIKHIVEACPTEGSWVEAGEDDAAVLPDGTVVNFDAMTRSRHVPKELKDRDLGWKFVASVVSDVGAMGGEPSFFGFSVCLDDEVDVEQLILGISEGLREFGTSLVGGDIVEGDELALSGTCLGKLKGEPLLMSNARPGDLVAVTGPLGGPNAFVRAILNGLKLEETLYERFARPRPPVEVGVELARSGYRVAVTDISDGLLAEAEAIARRSGVAIEIYAWEVPVDEGVREIARRLGVNPVDLALEGGEDYEFLICGPEDVIEEFDLTTIGRVTEGDGVRVVRDTRARYE
ncbi:thiamine-phosphate kinase [Methanopyrus sp. SNP6]|uniref:thiamine-phosphate kinase n=1 Tax=Methanopyrus sp. SNP6 TaxID=1937005 RepID=UPI00143B7B80|nr:thiamine-phosphate kinase [Methanopyrus sp. SNP6]